MKKQLKNYKNSKMCNRYKKPFTLFVSLVLSSLLPTPTFANQTNESDGDIIFGNNNPVVINEDTIIGSINSRYDVQTNTGTTKIKQNITINNNATFEIFATNTTNYGYVFAQALSDTPLTWQGGTIKIDFLASGYGGMDITRGGILADAREFNILSNLDFTYREPDNTTNFRTQGVTAVGSYNEGGKIKLLGSYVKIDAIGHESQNHYRGIFSLLASKNGSIYLNANDDGTLRNKNAIIQIKGSISTGLKTTNTNEGSGKIYAHFSGKDSYLEGNVYAGLYGGNSNMNLSFSNNASMTGEIYALGNGDHKITFDNAYFKGRAGYVTGTGDNTTLTFNNNAQWLVSEFSRVTNLTLNNEGSEFNLDLYSAPRVPNIPDAAGNIYPIAEDDLRVLEVKNLISNGGQVLLGVDGNKSDKIKIENLRAGTLYISAKHNNIAIGNFNTHGDTAIVLVSANSSSGEVKGGQIKKGIGYIVTTLEHQVSNNSNSVASQSQAPSSAQTTTETWSKVEDEGSVNHANKKHRWVLSKLSSKVDEELVNKHSLLISNPYRMLMIESNNLNKRMGDLRDIPYNQGAWIRVFNGSNRGEGIKNLYTNIQLGYDYGVGIIGAKNYSGIAFSTSIVDISANQYNGKANTYSLAAYNAYIADSGLYVDTIAKYLYTNQKLNPNTGSHSNFGNHALSLGAEVGYRAYMGKSHFYFEPQVELIGGLILGVKDINLGIIHEQSVKGELKMTTALNARVGVVQGYSLKTQNGLRADFRLGASLVNETVSDNTPIRLYDGITEAQRNIGNNIKAVFNVGTNLVLTEQWRIYIDAERSFGGRNANTDYQANVGARLNFGDKIVSLPKPQRAIPLNLKERGENKN